jgi:hypothetical protein
MSAPLIERLIGDINGINKVFTITNIYRPGSTWIYWNGVFYAKDDDKWGFAETGESEITTIEAPLTNDVLFLYFLLSSEQWGDSVYNLTELSNVSESDREDGQARVVESENAIYRFDTSAVVNGIPPSDVDNGRWYPTGNQFTMFVGSPYPPVQPCIPDSIGSPPSEGTMLIERMDELEKTAHGTIYLAAVEAIGSGHTISNIVYADDPNNVVIADFTSSTVDIRLTLDSSYPNVQVVTSVDYYTATLPQIDEHFKGTIDIQVSSDGEDIIAYAMIPSTPGEELEAANQEITVTIVLPPELTALSFSGSYPELSWNPGTYQTAVAAGNNFNIAFTSNIECVGARVLDQDACVLETFDFASTTSGTITATIADRGDVLQALPAWVQVKDANGAYGDTRATNHDGGIVDATDLINLNDIYATGSINPTIVYPGIQAALKNVESATLGLTASLYDEVLFDDNSTGDLDISNPTTFEAAKNVTRLVTAADKRFTGTNFRMILRRLDNGTETIVTSLVKIAHVAISDGNITLPATKLRSGGNNDTTIQSHVIHVILDQPTLSAPSLAAATNGGTWTGSWTGGDQDWTRTLLVHDDDDHVTHTWGAFSVTNLAGIVTTTIDTGDTQYIIEGFVARDLLFAPATPTSTFGVTVSVYENLRATLWELKGTTPLLNPVQGNLDDIEDTFTITDSSTAYCNDATLVGQNTLGMYLLGFEETI